MPGSTPGGRLASATFTGKVVTSDSVPGFLMVAFCAISTTSPSKLWPSSASTASSAC
jgi:hypothetical protein